MGCLNLRALPWVHAMFRLMADRRRIILQLYSTIGGILLFRDGPFLFFTYPEWYAIVMTLFALTQLRASYVGKYMAEFLWPSLVLPSSTRFHSPTSVLGSILIPVKC